LKRKSNSSINHIIYSSEIEREREEEKKEEKREII